MFVYTVSAVQSPVSTQLLAVLNFMREYLSMDITFTNKPSAVVQCNACKCIVRHFFRLSNAHLSICKIDSVEISFEC